MPVEEPPLPPIDVPTLSPELLGVDVTARPSPEPEVSGCLRGGARCCSMW